MAKFTTFDAPQETAGPIRVRRATAEDFGGDLKAVIAAGRDIKQFGKILDKRQEDAAALFREETIADERLYFATRLQELKETLPNGGEGAFEILNKEFEERTRINSDFMKTNTARNDFGLQMRRLQSNYLSKAIGVESAAVAAGERQTFEKILNFNANAVRADPSDETFDDSMMQIRELIGRSRLTGKNKTKFEKEAFEDLRIAQVEGLLSPENITSAEDAEQILERLKSEKFRKSLPRKAYDVALDRAQKLVKQYTNQEETAFIDSIRERVREESSGLADPGGEVTDEELVLNIKDPKKLSAARTLVNNGRRIGKFNRRLAGLSLKDIPVEREKLISELKTRGDFDFQFQKKQLLDQTETRLLAEARILEREAEEQDRKIISDMQEPLKAIMAGQPGVEISQSVIDNISDPEVRARAQQTLDSAYSVRDIKAYVAGASETELETEQAILQQAVELADVIAEPGSFFVALADLKAFDAAVTLRQKRIDQDPSKYAFDTHQTVRFATQNYADDASQENFALLVEAQIGAQVGSMGIDRRDVHLLPTDLVAQFKDEKRRVTTEPKAPEQIYNLIRMEQQRAGEKHWPLVMKQLREAGAFTAIELISAGMTRPDQFGPAQDLIVAAGLDAQGAFKNIASSVKSEINMGVINQTKDLSATLSRGIAGGEIALLQQQEAIGTLARFYVSGGDTAEGAVKRAAKAVVMDNYNFSTTFRVPVVDDLPVETAEIATAQTLAIMDFKDIKIPLGFASKEDNRRQYANAVKGQGYWATNGDETGLVLMAPNGVVVRHLDDSPVELLWDAMRGATTSNLFEVGF